jgi:hypothetical protein
MKLKQEFYKLPIAFDAKQLEKEIVKFRESDWIPHPTGYAGNSAIPLISVNGLINDDFIGPMLPTPHLKQCPYIQQVIAAFKSVISRSRLMRLAGQHEVPEHSDINYHWYSRVRIHVPIITNSQVGFYCGDKVVHMSPGEAWIFDSWKMHKVVNASDETRTHLVIDTCGSADFWEMVNQSEEIYRADSTCTVKPQVVSFDPGKKVDIKTEQFNAPVVMSPGEVDALAVDIINDLLSANGNDPGQVKIFIRAVNHLRQEWRSIWALHGSNPPGWDAYRQQISQTLERISTFQSLMLGSNFSSAPQVLNARILQSALNPEIAEQNYAIASRKFIPTDSIKRPSHTGKGKKKSPSRIKTGRNETCPCGSGRKYKHCHGSSH